MVEQGRPSGPYVTFYPVTGRACLSMTKTTKKINLNEKLISTLD